MRAFGTGYSQPLQKTPSTRLCHPSRGCPPSPPIRCLCYSCGLFFHALHLCFSLLGRVAFGQSPSWLLCFSVRRLACQGAYKTPYLHCAVFVWCFFSVTVHCQTIDPCQRPCPIAVCGTKYLAHYDLGHIGKQKAFVPSP